MYRTSRQAWPDGGHSPGGRDTCCCILGGGRCHGSRVYAGGAREVYGRAWVVPLFALVMQLIVFTRPGLGGKVAICCIDVINETRV